MPNSFKSAITHQLIGGAGVGKESACGHNDALSVVSFSVSPDALEPAAGHRSSFHIGFHALRVAPAPSRTNHPQCRQRLQAIP